MPTAFNPRLDILPDAQRHLWPATMLAAAAIIYGGEFNPLLSLKAISYFGDRSLADLPLDLRRGLIEAVQAVLRPASSTNAPGLIGMP